MEKCAIFIDGGYLDALLKNWGNFPLDYNAFTDWICETINCELLRIYYYNCLPLVRKMYDVICSNCQNPFQVHFDSDEGAILYCDACAIIKNLRINRIIIPMQTTIDDQNRYKKRRSFYNKLKETIARFEIKYGHLQLIGNQFKQKGIDVKMSLDIVDKCFSKQIQHAVIIAGDSDFIPAIQKAKDCGAIVHLFCNKKKINRELLEEVDEIRPLTYSFIQQFKRLE